MITINHSGNDSFNLAIYIGQSTPPDSIKMVNSQSRNTTVLLSAIFQKYLIFFFTKQSIIGIFQKW
jgi:hypothetical protein